MGKIKYWIVLKQSRWTTKLLSRNQRIKNSNIKFLSLYDSFRKWFRYTASIAVELTDRLLPCSKLKQAAPVEFNSKIRNAKSFLYYDVGNAYIPRKRTNSSLMDQPNTKLIFLPFVYIFERSSSKCVKVIYTIKF